MAKGKKGRGQKARRGGGEWRWLVPLIFAPFVVSLAVIGATWQTQGKFPVLTLPALGFGTSAPATAAPARTSPPVATAPAVKTPPAAAPTRAAAPASAPAGTQAAPSQPTPRAKAAIPTVAPTSTPTPKVVLKVPIYRQEHALSCEAASLRMALAAFGLQVPEDRLLASLARDLTPRSILDDGMIQWGDPEAGFVGAWDGVFLKDGYGVYERPIAELAMSLGYEAVRYGKNVGPEELYSAVRGGYPSIVWMPYDLTVKGRGAWSTPSGKRVPYVVTEHAVVLAGIDPEGVYYADPMKPAIQHASFAAFEKAIAEIDGRYVTVRP